MLYLQYAHMKIFLISACRIFLVCLQWLFFMQNSAECGNLDPLHPLSPSVLYLSVLVPQLLSALLPASTSSSLCPHSVAPNFHPTVINVAINTSIDVSHTRHVLSDTCSRMNTNILLGGKKTRKSSCN